MNDYSAGDCARDVLKRAIPWLSVALGIVLLAYLMQTCHVQSGDEQPKSEIRYRVFTPQGGTGGVCLIERARGANSYGGLGGVILHTEAGDKIFISESTPMTIEMYRVDAPPKGGG